MRRCALGFIALCLLMLACARASGPEPGRIRERADGGLPVDAATMAYLSMARAIHHEANLKEDDDVPGAIATLVKLTVATKPHPGERVPEIEEVLADTYARIAELEVRAGHPSKATESVERGLLYAEDRSYFRGHLLELGGIAEETRAHALADGGHLAESTAAKAHAVDLLHQAVLVQEQVVADSLRAAKDGASK